MKKILMKLAMTFIVKTILPFVIKQFEEFSHDLVVSSRTAVSEHDVEEVVDIAKSNVKALFTKVGVDISL